LWVLSGYSEGVISSPNSDRPRVTPAAAT
jgi:hypothetical protein